MKFCLSALGHPMVITMGDRDFAVCPKHTAKADMHTAKALPYAAHGNQASAKPAFAVCFISGTRQSLCRVHIPTNGKNKGRDRKGDVVQDFAMCPADVAHGKLFLEK